ncbi:MAG TPA: Ldh family oxidoreductase [Myxococcota bacterium]|nr:Ldh family oxidoreductase [Myxococcota bacterium]HRY93761.1 Ldh family oxidoreductase [Myxococcota bacterium]HSA21018.1 Ldh family oxidoreductase [Myxococcota bacterium]
MASGQERIDWVPFDALERFMRDVFVAVGVPPEDAAVCAEVLITADKRGIESHGIGRMKPIYYDRLKQGIQFARTEFEIVREGPTTAVVDGHHGMGHVIGQRAMQLCIDKARRYGLGMVAVRNSTHYGIAGYYSIMACQAGMIGMTGSNARPSIAPTFGVENMLGTNPMTFGLPTDEDFPFVIDCATSVSQRGKIEWYEREGKQLPPGWVIDEQGRTRTDTAQILKDLVKGTAALTPLGGLGEETAGYKGYGYATVVEMLCAALQQGAFMKGLLGFEGGKPVPYKLGHFFLAIDVEAFCPLQDFKRLTGEICRQLRASKKAPGATRIYTAGEKEHLVWLERKDKGAPVNGALRKHIDVMRQECKLGGHRFPWDPA